MKDRTDKPPVVSFRRTQRRPESPDALPERRYGIREVSELLDVPVHVLRQWEAKIPQLRPRRARNNRRYYLEQDIDIARRIKQLVRHERMSMEGARIQLARELRGEGRPRTRKEALELVRKMEDEILRLLEIMEEPTEDSVRPESENSEGE